MNGVGRNEAIQVSEEQIIGVLKGQEAGAKRVDVCRRHDIAQSSIKWRAKRGGREASEAKQLKKLLAEAMLATAALQDLASKKMVTPGAKQEAVAHAREHHGLSERWACRLVGVSRRVVRNQTMSPDDALLQQYLRELVGEHRRFGYLFAREGLALNHKRLLRIYHEEGLKVRRCGGRKRALGTRAPMTPLEEPNRCSSLIACGSASYVWSTI